MEEPNKESCHLSHKKSYGQTACNIIEVSDDEFNLFLGVRTKNKNDLAQIPFGEVDAGYRTILLLNICDFS